VAAALSELGVALGEPIDREEFTALFDGQMAAVEVKGWAKSALRTTTGRWLATYCA